MIIKYLKIWANVVREILDFKNISIIFLFYVILFFSIYFLFETGTTLSLLLTLLIILVRQATKLFMFYRKIVEDKKYDLILLKPIDPLVGLLIYNKDPMDVFLLLPILFLVKFKKNK